MKNIEGEKGLIKNIVYLDVDKMYSMSSQVFEGVTEYILSEKVQGKDSSESQKGPMASGMLLGEILRQQETVSEKKVLIDHSYSLFEKKLLDEGRVTVIDASAKSGPSLTSLRANSFVKVRGRVIFNDMLSIKGTITNFNKVGRALATVTKFGELQELKTQLEIFKEGGGDQSQRRALEEQIKLLSNGEKLQKFVGLYQDPDFLAQLATTLEYGYQDQLEVTINCDNEAFSANLKRECLREREEMFIRKYSRHSEVDFTLFGVITQITQQSGDDIPLREGASIKEAVMNMVAVLTNLEQTFTGRRNNESIIDPIAMYTEIR